MDIAARRKRQTRQPTFSELYVPKLVTVFREGYGLAELRADVASGLTVAIVALPLSMAIAIASGVTPDRGLYTAVVGGFVVALLGGSRFQVGGPAGAFIVLVALTVERHGIDGTILATAMAGVFLIVAGLLRLGTYIKFIPYPVTVGFTFGIAVIILTSQIKDLLGLTLGEKEPGEFVPKIEALARSLHTANASAIAIAAVSIFFIVVLRRLRPHWPGILIAVAVAAVATWALSLPVETIGTRFGGIPRELPHPAWPAFSLAKAQAVLPDAIAFALLAAIEFLLSAVVADGMTGRRHRSNCELVAQGVANIGSALFGGICVTGLIARTATNIRAGARGPVSSMLHSLFLLLFMLVAAPLASFIPLGALAAVLAVVAWNMAEKREFSLLIRSSRGDAIVLLATFLLTIFRDLTEGILVGFALGAALFINRMAQMTEVEADTPLVPADRADFADGDRVPYDSRLAADPDILVYRINGAFFFGAASSVGAVLDGIADTNKAFVIDFAAVPFLDSTAANAMSRVANKAVRQGIRLYITGASPSVRRTLLTHGVGRSNATYRETIARAVADIKGERETQAAAVLCDDLTSALGLQRPLLALDSSFESDPGCDLLRLALLACQVGCWCRERSCSGEASAMLESRRDIALACTLSALAGYVDGIGYVHLGGLFVSFMSGNSTRLGVSLAKASWLNAAVALGLIVLFVAGAAVGSVIVLGRRVHRQAWVLVAEALLLAAAGLSYELGHSPPAIAAIVLAMGLENAVFQVDGGGGLGLTYVTGTLVKVGQLLGAALSGGHHWAWVPNFLLWAALVLGSACGALAYYRINLSAIWFAAGLALVLAAIVIRIRPRH